MLTQLIHDVYCKLNRLCCSSPVTHQPQPPRRSLPGKGTLKRELLEKISCMQNPPWEPPSREDGEDEAMELHRLHFTKHLTSSFENCSLHQRKTATPSGSDLLMLIASDLCDMMMMETTATMAG